LHFTAQTNMPHSQSDKNLKEKMNKNQQEKKIKKEGI
jgi:hypothetical protein